MRRLWVGLLLLGGCETAGNGGGGVAPVPASAQVDRVEVVSAPERGGTYLLGEEVVFALTLTRGGMIEATGSAWLEFDLGLARQPAALRPTAADRLEFAYRLRRGDHDRDGVSVPAGEIVLSAGGRLRLGGEDLDLRVPGLPADPDHRVFARFDPGDPVLLDATFELPGVELSLGGTPGCATVEEMTPIVEAALGGEPGRAESLFFSGVQLGRCTLLDAGSEAIFLSAEIAGEEDSAYDLALVFAETDNWWTLGDFLNESE